MSGPGERHGSADGGRIVAIAFTDRGEALARTLMAAVDGEASRSGQPDSMKEWTEREFPRAKALIFVGAAGIAVRAIAPWVSKKTEDPAVIVIDERGENVIPILSGHLGGANDLARRLADVCGGRCVITTATDVNGVFAVDEWARRQNCEVLEPEKIRRVSGGLLAGGTMTVRSEWPIRGKMPDGLMMTAGTEADIALDIRPEGEQPLHLVPRICCLGVGCRRGTTATALEHFLRRMLLDTGVSEKAIAAVASIDIKEGEAGLRQFCESHGWPLQVYSAYELEQVEGSFSGSDFVTRVTGVDNVCERSAVRAAEGGELIRKKLSADGITMALAVKEFAPDWIWQEE